MKIKPCSFCGGKANKPYKFMKQWYIDHRMDCWIGHGRTQVFVDKEVPYWNKRKTT